MSYSSLPSPDKTPRLRPVLFFQPTYFTDELRRMYHERLMPADASFPFDLDSRIQKAKGNYDANLRHMSKGYYPIPFFNSSYPNVPQFPQDQVLWWPGYGIATRPDLRYSRQTDSSLLLKHQLMFKDGQIHEGGTIVRGADIVFITDYRYHPGYSDEPLLASKANMRAREVVSDLTRAVAIFVEPLMQDNLIPFVGAEAHIDRYLGPPIKLGNSGYLIFIREGFTQ